MSIKINYELLLVDVISIRNFPEQTIVSQRVASQKIILSFMNSVFEYSFTFEFIRFWFFMGSYFAHDSWYYFTLIDIGETFLDNGKWFLIFH